PLPFISHICYFAPMQKERLEKLYHSHHVKGARYGYLFCHGKRIPYLKQWVGKGKKVLDLGCRDGMLTAGYVEENDILGVDIDQQALQKAGQQLGIKTAWLDLNSEWPWESASFDRIVACEILEHLFLIEDVLQKVHRTLKKGGLFIGSVPNAFRLRNRWKFLTGHEYDTDATHVRQFSYDKLERMLRTHFSEVTIIPLEGKICPFLSVGPKTPKRIGQLFAKDLLWKAVK
ncbi:MAG: class I SAM-dependent methyltransferase, partial [Verrucomicrobiota bacterium]|nr:class I SAM-dependent methyltransferase [Verrucomicrobiota bacterium]